MIALVQKQLLSEFFDKLIRTIIGWYFPTLHIT